MFATERAHGCCAKRVVSPASQCVSETNKFKKFTAIPEAKPPALLMSTTQSE